jgi:hypothetical protein
MAAPAGAFVMRNATITVDATAYANQCTKARLVPDTPIQTLRTLVPDGAIQDVDSAVWSFELSMVQDWTDAQGLARALHDAAGTEVDIVLAPKTGGVSAAFTCIAMSPPFGGDQGAFTVAEMTLPVVGQPVFTDPV